MLLLLLPCPQECPFAHDPDHDNPPLLHELGEQDARDVVHKFKLSMSGMSPLMMMAAGGQSPLSPEVLAGLEPHQVQGMLQMAAMQGMMGGGGGG